MMGVVGEGEPSDDGEDIRAELDQLRQENARLRSLLGLDERDADGHTTTWSPMLIPDTVRSASADRDSSNESKLALLTSLFGARSDVYATRWENASTGKSGWSPATTGGWSRQRNPRDYLALTDEVFASHLRGHATIAIPSPSRNCSTAF